MTPAGRSFVKFFIYIVLGMLGLNTLMPWLYGKFGAENIAGILFCTTLSSLIDSIDKRIKGEK